MAAGDSAAGARTLQGLPVDRAVADALAHTDLFAGLDPAARRTIAASMTGHTLPRGQTLFLEGDPGDGLYVLLSGELSVFRSSATGDRAVLTVLTPPATVGEVALLDGSVRSASVEALEPSAVLMLTRQDFLGLIHREPSVADAVLHSMGALVRRLTDQAADHVFLDLTGRVAKALVTVTERRDPPSVSLTQRQLAELVGGSRQSINAALQGFTARGYLHTEGRLIILDDREALRRRA